MHSGGATPPNITYTLIIRSDGIAIRPGGDSQIPPKPPLGSGGIIMELLGNPHGLHRPAPLTIKRTPTFGPKIMQPGGKFPPICRFMVRPPGSDWADGATAPLAAQFFILIIQEIPF